MCSLEACCRADMCISLKISNKEDIYRHLLHSYYEFTCISIVIGAFYYVGKCLTDNLVKLEFWDKEDELQTRNLQIKFIKKKIKNMKNFSKDYCIPYRYYYPSSSDCSLFLFRINSFHIGKIQWIKNTNCHTHTHHIRILAKRHLSKYASSYYVTIQLIMYQIHYDIYHSREFLSLFNIFSCQGGELADTSRRSYCIAVCFEVFSCFWYLLFDIFLWNLRYLNCLLTFGRINTNQRFFPLFVSSPLPWGEE